VERRVGLSLGSELLRMGVLLVLEGKDPGHVRVDPGAVPVAMTARHCSLRLCR
jgi:hypothetical protein